MFGNKMKSRIALLLAALTLVLFLVSACGVNNGQSVVISNIVSEYVDFLNARDYDAAYDFLSGSAQQQVNRYSFEQKHEQYFNLLEISNVSTTVSQSSDDPLHSMAYVTFKYDSELCGIIENFQIIELIKQENKWKIDWSPQILHNDMDWYSTIRGRVTKGKRGEIFASGKLVAANSPGISILISPLEVENQEDLITMLSPLINVSSDKIQKKLDASVLQAQVVVDRLRLRNKPTTDERSEVILNVGRGEVFNVLDEGKKHQPLPEENQEIQQPFEGETSSPNVAQSIEEDTIPGFYKVEFKTSVKEDVEEVEVKKGFFEKIFSFFSGDKKELEKESEKLEEISNKAKLEQGLEQELEEKKVSEEESSEQTALNTDSNDLSSELDLESMDSLPLFSDIADNLEPVYSSDNEPSDSASDETYSFIGYVYAPYVRLKYSQDLILVKSFRADMIDDAVLDTLSQIPGVIIDKESYSDFRVYPYGESMFHAIGYTGIILDAELKTHIKESEKKGAEPVYDDTSVVGLMGVESQFQDYLKEKDGYDVYIADENGAVKKMLYQKKAVDGSDVQLTLDPDLQKWSYDLLRLYLSSAQTGAVFTMDPQTGAVSCMVSYPSIDPNKLPYFTKQEWATIFADEDRAPLFNRVLNGSYIPGSILKPFTAVLGLEMGVISTDTVFPYQEFIVDNKWDPKEHGESAWNWNSPPIKRVENRFGTCDFSTSLRESDNIFFSWTALKIGADPFTDYFKNELGFEEPIPFDLNVKASHFYNPTKIAPDFNSAMLADSGYGQGQLIVTPLHAGTIFSAFANNGDAMAPYIVESINKTEGLAYVSEYQATQKIWLPNIISDDYVLSSVTSVLEDVMSFGTGKTVQSPYQLAGKTGTAQIGRGKELSWLVSYKSEGAKDFLASVTIEYTEGEIESRARYPITSSLFRYEHDKNSKDIDASGTEILEERSRTLEAEEAANPESSDSGVDVLEELEELEVLNEEIYNSEDSDEPEI